MAAGSNNIVTDGLIFCADPANKRCYSGSGDTCTDLAGGVTGSLENETALSSDWNGVFDFDGTDDYIDFGSPAALQNQVGTVIAWGRWDYTTTWQGGLVSYLYNHSSLAHGWNLLNHGTYRIGRSLASNGTYDYWTGSYSYQFDKDEWVMASFSFAGQYNPVITYRNDVVINYDSSQNTIVTYTGANLLIGRTDTADYLKEWFGQIGPVYIYNRALTQDEITQMYEALKPRFAPRIAKEGLVGNWDAGDPESYSGGLTCKDTANGTASTLTNMEASDFNPANGGYWEFDGTDEYIQCSTDSILQPQSFSVEAWVYDDQTEHYLPIVSWANEYYPAVWTSYHSSTQRPIIYMDGPDLRYFDATAASVAGWHHVVFTYTYDDITTGAFYVDGASIAVYQTYDGTKDPTNTCRIGRAYTQYYKGSMGLVRMYDRALSVAEILDNYNKTKGRFGH